MNIVESAKEVETFMFYWNGEPSLVIPIWCDLQKHPMNTEISFLYVRFRDGESDQGDVKMDFIIPFNHNDCIIPEIDLSNSTQPKKVWNEKGLLQTELGIQNMYDLQTEFYFGKNKLLDLDTSIEHLSSFYTRNGLVDDIGKSIPIVLFNKIFRDFTNPIMDSLNTIVDSWVDSEMIPLLSRIEENGIRVDIGKFFDRWPDHGKQLKNDKIYTEYNPYTITSRPTNRHGGINFGALNKKDGTREVFIPSKGNTLLQFDYDAYHIRIIAKLIGYEIPHESGHQWLADMYGCSYEESKGRTFQILYGGVSEIDKRIPFFKKVDEFIQKLWRQINKDGFITTGKNRKIRKLWIDKPNAQKVFNYLLQSTETELNMEILKKLYKNNIESLIMYSYDAFVFDIGEEDLKNNGTKIKEIIESNGFTVKGSFGSDYSKL